MNVTSLLCLTIFLHSCEKDPYKNALPKPATAMATNITQTGATLTGMVYLEGNSTTALYEYGSSSSYGNSTSSSHSGEYHGSWPVPKPVTGLTPGTTYHFRLVATNKNGISMGSDQTFTTLN